MSRIFQVFRAPGPEDAALPTPASPWHVAREARIPQAHWEVIVAFARSRSAHEADLLERAAFAEDEDAAALVAAYPGLDALLGQLIDALAAAAPVESGGGDIDDPMPNEELARMAAAVRAVVREAARRGEPFESWAD